MPSRRRSRRPDHRVEQRRLAATSDMWAIFEAKAGDGSVHGDLNVTLGALPPRVRVG